ncbi:RNA polymerase sigma-70 factor, ECF subfamily [Variovorax sp. PDC80]|jgi:RNA polymerase sigma factor (sigma-70 family)|uniref:RNA polymerase sigma factor n=1 Tax=Variovorax sp. PDC80 TaxID=1882827 RepID=UPI0008E2BAE1|nr:RNA polymerase sigma factor [Variovorax sp. PDC80]SFO70516.1 RNA polymerase sigma-70 factor, ECF subfamily [Variovorax sp. PDC80]
MADDTQLVLLNYLGKHYTSLKQRLTRKLGNADDAGDALHDTWLRLKGSEDHGAVQNPGAYLSRMAVNIAVDVQRRNSRLLSGDDIDELLEEVEDPAPGPARSAEIRSELEAVLTLLERMPERRRAVALLVHAEGLTQSEAARRLGVSLRTVEYELQRVHERLDAYLAAEKK